MRTCSVGIIGSGWRAEYFGRCAKALPNLFHLAGFVTTNKAKGTALFEKFDAPIFETVEELLSQGKPEYVVLSVAASAASGMLVMLARLGIPVLMETPAAPTMEALREANANLPKGAKVQVAEQYFLRPVQQAHLRFLAGGKLGRLTEARLSMTSDYHSMSLLRKYLNLGFSNANIFAHEWKVRGYNGYERTGVPEKLTLMDRPHTIAVLEFPQGVAIYDCEDMQHRSFIRTSEVQIKGETGEIFGSNILYLMDTQTPMRSSFQRVTTGEDENIEGYGLKGIVADGQWVYKNPFPDSRLVDDEIAVAQAMVRMVAYLDQGKSFYSFAEASQDMYLALLVRQAAAEKRNLRSETQVWVE